MTDSIDTAADRLIAARRTQQPAPLAEIADEAAAYAVQARVGAALRLHPTPARHWKSGGATVETQTHAPLPDAGIWGSPADGSRWPLFAPGVEAEVALRLKRDVTAAMAAALDDDGARALVDAMTVTIELVDSRWQDGEQAPALAKLADYQSHGALVVGAWRDYQPDHDWAAQALEVRIGAAPVRSYRGSHSMVDPVRVLPGWLRHATAGGTTVPAGTVVTTGSWCGLLPAARGDRVQVEFPGLGAVAVLL
ncbi:MAG: fumarylacetoacetate hydrolase family protein [Lautropia sp.]